MAEDPRCCGSGTCIIDTEGRCWCGQQWDGTKMCAPPLQSPAGGASFSLQQTHRAADNDTAGDAAGTR